MQPPSAKQPVIKVMMMIIIIIVTDNSNNHNYNKIVKSDWLSTALISALIGQYVSCLNNWTVRAITCALKWLFFLLLAKTILEFSCVLILKRALYIKNFVKVW